MRFIAILISLLSFCSPSFGAQLLDVSTVMIDQKSLQKNIIHGTGLLFLDEITDKKYIMTNSHLAGGSCTYISYGHRKPFFFKIIGTISDAVKDITVFEVAETLTLEPNQISICSVDDFLKVTKSLGQSEVSNDIFKPNTDRLYKVDNSPGASAGRVKYLPNKSLRKYKSYSEASGLMDINMFSGSWSVLSKGDLWAGGSRHKMATMNTNQNYPGSYIYYGAQIFVNRNLSILTPLRLFSEYNELAQKKASNYFLFMGEDYEGEFSNKQVNTESSSEFIVGRSVLSGTSGAPLVSVQKKIGTFKLLKPKIKAMVKSTSRFFRLTHLVPLASILKLYGQYLAGHRGEQSAARWKLNQGELHRVWPGGTSEINFNSVAAARLLPVGNASTVDGGNASTVDGGNASTVDGADGDLVQQSFPFNAEALWRGQSIIGFVDFKNDKGSKKYYTASAELLNKSLQKKSKLQPIKPQSNLTSQFLERLDSVHNGVIKSLNRQAEIQVIDESIHISYEYLAQELGRIDKVKIVLNKYGSIDSKSFRPVVQVRSQAGLDHFVDLTGLFFDNAPMSVLLPLKARLRPSFHFRARMTRRSKDIESSFSF